MENSIYHDAQSALASSPIYALRNLKVEEDNERLLINGKVDSFYHKQMAQEAVRLVSQGVNVVNQVNVIDE